MSVLFEQITAEIISAIEAGAETFQMPWHRSVDNALPLNALTGKAYRGTNVIVLWAAAFNTGYPRNVWATYRQWTELGAQVRKGERGATVVFWKSAGESDCDEDGGEGKRGRRFIARASRVFNVMQVDGYDEPEALPVSTIERIADAQAFFDALPAALWHGSDSAFFDPACDLISMPDIDLFHSAEGYYSVLAHELTHWTGTKQRLDRNLKGRFGSAAYAMEELVAELGAAFICARLGIATIPRSDHAPYINCWLTVLGQDSRAIVAAASQAQTAVDYLFNLVSPAETVAQQAEMERAG